MVVRLRIPARAEYIILCRLALTGIARLRSLSDELVADLKLALTEAASNSVRHAAAERGRREVHNALADERLGQAPDLVHQPTGGDGRVVSERLVSGVDELEHGRGALVPATVAEHTARGG